MADCGCVNPPHFGPYLADNCGGSSFVLFMTLVDAIIKNTCDISDVCGRVRPISEPAEDGCYIMADCGCVNPPHFGPYLADNCGGSSFVLFMTLVDAIIRNTCDVSDVCGRVRPLSEPAQDGYDFIVIGGGSGGSAIAGLLARDREDQILLLEAGVDEPETYQVPAMVMAYNDNHEINWDYSTTNEPVACQANNGRCSWLRAKMLGGCSSFNQMMFTRGTPADYDLRWRDQLGNKNWGWNDVLPYFKKFENNLQYGKYDPEYHGRDGPVTISDPYYTPEFANAILQGASEAGFPISQDLNGVNYTGFTISQGYMQNGTRVSMAKAYLRTERDNTHLDVMINSTVTRILLNEAKRAVGVEFIYNNKTFTVRARKEIILAAGTINTPKILLHSGIGPKDALDAVGIEQIHDLPGVGQNLSNHVGFLLDYWVNSTINYNTVSWESLSQYINDRTGPLASAGIPTTAIIPTKFTTAEDPDLQLYFLYSSNRCSVDGASNKPVDASDPTAPKSVSINIVNLRPKSRGRITLKSNDPLDNPIMVGNDLTVKEDEDRLLDAVRIVQRLVNSTTLKDTWKLTYMNTVYGTCADTYEFDTDDYWRCAFRYRSSGENHQTSSARMGPTSDPWSVVNQELKVIGIESLRIVDASAMPVVTSGNINAPIVMIAERCHEFIRKEWAN